MIDDKAILASLEEKLMDFGEDPKTKNIGKIDAINDGVVVASGLSRAFYGEIVECSDGTQGVILSLGEDTVSIILLGKGENLREGDEIKTTGKLLSINASEQLLGRIVNPLGRPLDGKAKLTGGKAMPLEKIAAGVVDREPVDTPLKTGIIAIDAMIPIGRGQRELIIGDRGLGKTAIAIDTIINQGRVAKGQKSKDKNPKTKGSPVICVYVAIGQKKSTIAQIIERLRIEKALDYTIVVAAAASDPAALQYLAPFAGCAIAEYFMEKGQDALIVYDDLTKHAWAYRQISLVLKRPAGREAYPGDIFYLHSRLLERAVRLNKKHGGGSMTALPVIETQADDISSYIPTNVISITDGQIYLQGDLFNAGIRPAVNAGLSVSRVGGAAQTGAMKSVAGKLRLELAQFRDLAAFAQFGSELDPATMQQLERGKRTTEILKQPQYHPLSEALEVASIWTVTNGFLDEIPTSAVSKYIAEYHEFLTSRHEKLLDQLTTGEKLNEDTIKKLTKAAEEFKKVFSA